MLITDQIGRDLTIDAPIRSIVSLVPSITELLVDLGCEDKLVGITKFCVHPTHLRKTKSIIGGTKSINILAIADLHPDLIIANKEENIREQVEELAARHTVYVADINNRKEAIAFIKSIGEVLGKLKKSSKIAHELESSPILPKSDKKVIYLIWRKPYMAAGSDTYISDMLRHNGYTNALSSNRYPELSEEQIVNINPDVIMLSSEPYPFKEKHIEEVSRFVPLAQVLVVDGEAFSWYGTRELHLGDYYENLKSQIV